MAGFGSTGGDASLKLNGGDSCTECSNTVCLHGPGANAKPGARVAICNGCRKAFCAKCGGPAQKSPTSPGKYSCPKCDVGS